MRVELNNQQTSFKAYKLGKNIGELKRSQTITSIDTYIKKATATQDPLIESDMDVFFDGFKGLTQTALEIIVNSKKVKGKIARFFTQVRGSINESTKGGITPEKIEEAINKARLVLKLPVPSEITSEHIKGLRQTVQAANKTEADMEQLNKKQWEEERQFIRENFGAGDGRED